MRAREAEISTQGSRGSQRAAATGGPRCARVDREEGEKTNAICILWRSFSRLPLDRPPASGRRPPVAPAISAISALIISLTLSGGVTLIAQRGVGGRGAPAAARTAAPIDLTG